MIHDVDESLRTLVRRDVLNGANVDISFEAPSKDWSSRRNAPTLNLYLYDIHEDMQRRGVQFEETRDERGNVVGCGALRTDAPYFIQPVRMVEGMRCAHDYGHPHFAFDA